MMLSMTMMIITKIMMTMMIAMIMKMTITTNQRGYGNTLMEISDISLFTIIFFYNNKYNNSTYYNCMT